MTDTAVEDDVLADRSHAIRELTTLLRALDELEPAGDVRRHCQAVTVAVGDYADALEALARLRRKEAEGNGA